MYVVFKRQVELQGEKTMVSSDPSKNDIVPSPTFPDIYSCNFFLLFILTPCSYSFPFYSIFPFIFFSAVFFPILLFVIFPSITPLPQQPRRHWLILLSFCLEFVSHPGILNWSLFRRIYSIPQRFLQIDGIGLLNLLPWKKRNKIGSAKVTRCCSATIMIYLLL